MPAAPMRCRSRTETAGERRKAAVPHGVFFTHLFSAPLTELEMAKGGSGCQLPKAVPELSYQGERETLVRTLTESRKEIQFMSEAANTESFARAVGCPNASSGTHSRSGSEPWARTGLHGGASLSESGRSCRDKVCRILHFTGHAQPGKLTFEDRYGQLQYIDEEHLLAMLQCQKKPADNGGFGPSFTFSNGKYNCTPGRSAERAGRAQEDGDHDLGGGYAPFEDVSEGIVELEIIESSSRCGGDAAGLRRMTDYSRASRAGLQLVFLSSCHSASLAQVFIQAGVRHVIAVKEDEKILDHKAHDFAHSFYSALFRGDTVQEAFDLGLNRLRVSQDRAKEGEKFVLLPTREDGGDHDIPAFDKLTPGLFHDLRTFQPLYSCEVVTEHFWGRAVEVQKVVRHMVDDKRCITIIGQKGIGKTQVLLKACAYARERHVFGDLFFCRVEQGRDACQWLEEGFGLVAGSLRARSIDTAVATITANVTQRQRRQQRSSGSRAPRRSLLVLDRCERHLLVGEVRVELSVLLNRLFRALPNLTTAITMRASSPTALEGVGVVGEKVVVVEGLDNRSTAELFVKCCPRKLDAIEIDPDRHALLSSNGEPDFVQAMDAFANSDIVQALRGHPGCVVDLLRRVGLAERSVFLHRERLLEHDIPEIHAQYAYPENNIRAQPLQPFSGYPAPDDETAKEAFDRIVREGSGNGLYRQRERAGAHKRWGELCDTLKSCFAKRVPGAHGRPLSKADLEVFSEDEGLWGPGQSPPAARKAQFGGDVYAVVVSLDSFWHFWRWFWMATAMLRRTLAWQAGETVGVIGFAGFLKKITAVQMIAGAPSGTFLIRFSTSQGGALAVHYKSRKGQHISVLVNVDDRGQLWVPPSEGTDKEIYRDLAALVMDVPHLKVLYPDTPKEKVFFRPSQRSSWTQGMQGGTVVGPGVARGGGGYPPGRAVTVAGGMVSRRRSIVYYA